MRERLIRERIFFFIMIAILIGLSLILVWPYGQAILLAFVAVIILKPVYNWFLKKKWVRCSEKTAVGASVIVFILAIALPLFFIITITISQAASFFGELSIDSPDFSLESIIATVEQTIRSIGGEGVQIDPSQIAESVQGTVTAIAAWLGEVAINLSELIPQFMASALIVLVIIVVLLPRYNRPEQEDIIDLVPFPNEITQLYLDKINLMIIAIFKGTFLIAIVQGAAMGVVLWIAGVPYTMFFMILSMALSLIPLIGISLVAWPIGIILILTGQIWQGIFVILAFLLVISNIDTLMRPRLVPKGAYLNPALLILSIFGGIQLLGLVGIFYGPVIMILLVTSIEVYAKYMLRSDLETLQEGGKLDLEELGLASEEDQEEQNLGEMVVTTLKNLAARFRRDEHDRDSEDTAEAQVNG